MQLVHRLIKILKIFGGVILFPVLPPVLTGLLFLVEGALEQACELITALLSLAGILFMSRSEF